MSDSTPSQAIPARSRENVNSTVVATLSHSPGALANVVDVFREHSINMSRIRSRPSPSENAYEIEIDVAADISPEDIQNLIDSLPARNVAHMPKQDVPWFPEELADLDGFAVKTLDYGAELDADHPGFQDEAYRQRRTEIVENARVFRTGMTIPRVDYNEKEIETWGIVYDKLTSLFPSHACKQFNAIFPLLEQHAGYSRDNIPQLQDVSDFLEGISGFTLRPVQGLLSPRDFLNGLAFRVFHSTQYIRHHSKPMYTPEPDVCHELLGHVPLLADPEFAAFSQEVGLASLGATDDDIKRLSTLYWFTVEFGLVQEEDGPKAYGAGLLSSFGELSYCLSDEPEIRPLDMNLTCEQDYPITSMQPVYFLAKSFQAMTDDLRYWSSKLDRPFCVRYDPYTKRVLTLNTKQKIMAVMTNISSELSVLRRALEVNL